MRGWLGKMVQVNGGDRGWLAVGCWRMGGRQAGRQATLEKKPGSPALGPPQKAWGVEGDSFSVAAAGVGRVLLPFRVGVYRRGGGGYGSVGTAVGGVLMLLRVGVYRRGERSNSVGTVAVWGILLVNLRVDLVNRGGVRGGSLGAVGGRVLLLQGCV